MSDPRPTPTTRLLPRLGRSWRIPEPTEFRRGFSLDPVIIRVENGADQIAAIVVDDGALVGGIEVLLLNMSRTARALQYASAFAMRPWSE
jgi:hypothetical protein